MKLSKRFTALLAGVAATAVLGGVWGTSDLARAGSGQHGGAHWTGAWATAMQPPTGGDTNWSTGGFDDHSVRQSLRVSTGGAKLRVRLSNVYGESPVRLTGATIAKAGEGPAIRPETLRPLTFDHEPSVELPAGDSAGVASDPVALPTAALDKLTVTMYFDGPTGPATFHQAAIATSYRAEGDHLTDPTGDAFDETTGSTYFVSGVEVARALPSKRASVVTIGDSITDGVGGTNDADNRYPDELAERLVDEGKRLGVLNSGISGNRVLNDSTCFGEDLLSRLERDVLEQPGVRTVIVMEGINDIGFSEDDQEPCFQPNPEVTAEQLIDGYQTLIDTAHEHGLKVIGGTLTPFEGAGYYSERGERVRDTVNEWIRTSGEYDAVADFDAALADPANPDALLPAYDTGDHLHPSDKGFRAMAEAIDLAEL